MYVLIVYANSDGNDHDVFGPFDTKKEAYDYLYKHYEEDDDLDSDVIKLQTP